MSYANLPAADRSFFLDMKDQVTASIAKMWGNFIREYHLCTESDPAHVSRFICGGIAEMLMDYMSQAEKSEEKERKLIREIVLFSASVLGLNEQDEQMLMQSIIE